MIIATLAMIVSHPNIQQVLPFSLKQVRLLPGLQQERQQVDLTYLKSLDPVRLMYGYYVNAGLKPPTQRYGGWEAMGIEGHSLGHYLSACALMYAATGDNEMLAKTKVIVDELEKCQLAHKDGFIGGMPDAERIFSELRKRDIRSQGFDLNGNWVPWYNLHKTFAGLLDTYRETGNKKALAIFIKSAEWIDELTKEYTDADWQKMLACEHGGMNESLADLYSITKNPLHKELAEKFHHKAVLDPLEKGERKLAGKHGNTQIPKILGTARLYEVTGEKRFEDISRNFWSEVVEDHTYAMGGHGLGEHFGPPGKLSERLGTTNAETCNTYNMLKLTDHLFQWSPSTRLGDFYEQGQINHILTSEDLETAGVTYFVPLKMGGNKTYSSAFDDFTCCRGTGMENHAKYGEAIYYHRGSELWVNLYTPSVLDWSAQGVKVTQKTSYPVDDSSTFTVEAKKPKKLTLRFRCPAWASKGATLVCGTDKVSAKAGEWLEFTKEFKGVETLELTIPMELRTVPMPDNANRVAVMYGPSLLVAEWGGTKPRPGEVERSPVFLKDGQPVNEWLVKTGPRTWHTRGNMLPEDLAFRPFFDIQHERYSVYLDVFTTADWEAREAEYRRLEAEAAELNSRTLDFFQPGEMQAERDHNVQGEFSGPAEWQNRKGRHAWNGGWFSFEVKVDPSVSQDVVFTYWGSDRRTFDVLLDGQPWHTIAGTGQPADKFYDKVFVLTPEVLKGRTKVTIKLQAQKPNGWAGGLFGVRVMKAR
ncbi:MAG TPA: beta-L-arabinofuranosidase domain-containing protein [Fimbriimonas sp.]|nr:beta-L-arabinofuranosidase domain-containing protein [Fimbriimonas sp.]